MSGGLVVADVAGAAGSYLVDGAGTSTTGYCSDYFNAYRSLRPLRIVDFRQR